MIVTTLVIAFVVAFLWVQLEPTKLGAVIGWAVVWIALASVVVAVCLAFLAVVRLSMG